MIKTIKRKIIYKFIDYYIRRVGVRFYQTLIEIDSEPHTVLSAKITASDMVTFLFHKDTMKHIVYRNKKLTFINQTIFIISAEYPEHILKKLSAFSSIRLFISNNRFLLSHEDITLEVLLSIYLDFIELAVKANNIK